MSGDRKFWMCAGWFLAGVFFVVGLSACDSTHEQVPAHLEEGSKDTAILLYYHPTGGSVRKFCDPGDGIDRWVIYHATRGEGVSLQIRPASHQECR